MIISLYSSFAVVQFVNFSLVASGGRWKNTIMKFPYFEQRRKRSAILQLSISKCDAQNCNQRFQRGWCENVILCGRNQSPPGEMSPKWSIRAARPVYEVKLSKTLWRLILANIVWPIAKLNLPDTLYSPCLHEPINIFWGGKCQGFF